MFVAKRIFDLFALLVSCGLIGWSISLAVRGKKIDIRPIAGFEAMDEAIGRAAEMGKPLHFTPGFGGLVAATFAGLEALGYIAKKAAEYDVRLIVTVSQPETYAVTEQVERQAYLEAGKPESFRPEDCRFISPDQWAYASGVVGVLNREKVASNIMIGQFAAEALILAEAGNTVGAVQIAGTTNAYQIPFFVVACDYVILGDEMFAAGAHFAKNQVHLGSLRGEDLVKVICIGLIVVGAILTTFGNKTLSDLMAK
ncbi:MAG: hypothetical protein IMF26_03015 [Candidatus Fermentithermobacillus carboniphilus]|uniref:DUF6754 domain-containing protein n=1 Tax=Candidatus Fermentithermobacillus carboniphilus TaxID=3085328 RepID=A0AAT9LDC8_9FIRM|nr:MAG: hypothetical protein IMF26_03015 [Candidatus Fermentithermobacillus carboniphilus]